jgi:hypothetical protein
VRPRNLRKRLGFHDHRPPTNEIRPILACQRLALFPETSSATAARATLAEWGKGGA